MDKVINIEEALKRNEELEKENAELRQEMEYYRQRKISVQGNVETVCLLTRKK